MAILGTHVNFVCVFMISIGVLNLDWASCACVAGAPRSKGGCDYWKINLFNMSHKSLEIVVFNPDFSGFAICPILGAFI